MPSLNLKNNTLISLLFALFLIASVNLEYGMGISALLMFLISALALFYTQGNVLGGLEKIWLISILLFVGLVCIDILQGDANIGSLDAKSRWLLAIPVYLYVRRIGIDIRILTYGLIIALMVTGVNAWFQYEVHGVLLVGRNHIHFGQISLILSLSMVPIIAQTKNGFLRIVSGVALIFGIYAFIVSGSRGGWLALPIALLILLQYYKFSVVKSMALFGVFCVAFLSLYNLSNSIVKQQVEKTFDSVNAYFQDDVVETSSGYRLEMLKTSYFILKENHSLLGAGENNYNSQVRGLVKEGKVNESMSRFTDPHNQYLNNLIDHGWIGLLSLISLFFVPYVIFIKSIRLDDKTIYPLIGVLTVVTYSEFMLTTSTLEVQMMSLFGSFYLAIVMGCVSYKGLVDK